MAAVPIEGVDQSGFGMRAGLASAVAWAPNPQNPPFYADFPIKDGAVDPLVIAKWANNSPLAMVAEPRRRAAELRRDRRRRRRPRTA